MRLLQLVALALIAAAIASSATASDVTRCPYLAAAAASTAVAQSSDSVTDTAAASSTPPSTDGQLGINAVDIPKQAQYVSRQPAYYDSLAASQKLTYIWAQLLRNQTTANVVPLSTGLLFAESMAPSVDFVSDFIPVDRQKAVHGDGVVAKVELVIDSPSRYTGILATGSQYAVLRFSSVLDPTVVGGPIPSIAIKYFRDGKHSVNNVALNTNVPQTVTTNPFYLPLTNFFVGAPPSVIEKFSTVSAYPNFTGNWELSQHFNYYTDSDRDKQYTSETDRINFPWQLIYVPSPVIQSLFPVNVTYKSSADYYTQFLPPYFHYSSVANHKHDQHYDGDVLYWVYAVDFPAEQSFYLGKLLLKSDFYRSDFGDRTLFFKHTVEEGDIAFRPELGVRCPSEAVAGCEPCPQAYDCLNPHWQDRVDSVSSPMGQYYNPGRFDNAMKYSPIVERAFTAYRRQEYPRAN